jgi:hypothetical protein
MGTYHSDCQAPIKNCTKHLPGVRKGVRDDNRGYQKIKDMIIVNKSRISIFLKKKKRKNHLG